MFKEIIKWAMIIVLILAGRTIISAQKLQATMTNQGTTLFVKLKPNSTSVTTGFSNMEFFIRYPNTQTIAWTNLIANGIDFPSIAIQKNAPYTAGTDAGYTIVRFFLPPGTFTTSNTYVAGTEYEVFHITATGTGIATLEMMDRADFTPYYMTLVNETANIQLEAPIRFYGAGASGAVAIQSLPLSFALPLELTAFSGKAETNGNKLNWQTVNERNVSHFIVEKSTYAADKFQNIGEVKAVGHSSTPQYYSLLDAEPSQLNYYRLKMMDTNGQYTYSKTIALESKQTRKDGIEFYPNPANDVLNVVLKNKNYQTATVSLMDISGKTLVFQTKKGENTEGVFFTFNLKEFQNGVYSAVIVVDGVQTIHKVVVTK